MNRMFTRTVSSMLVLMLSGIAEPLVAQSSAPEQQPAAQNPIPPPIELPESPGASAPAANTAPATATTPQNSNPAQPPQPSGTAAAPAVRVSGSAASKPAGVAIAPPKQRQIRSWLIKFGFIAGAGAALGTVAALSAASPGRVPNSGH